MTTIKWLLLTIPALPFLELAAFYAVASQIGFLWSVILLFTTSIAGLIVLRHAFGQITSPIRVALAGGNLSSVQYNGPHGFVVLAGFLLLIPGFITDIAGLFLLLASPFSFTTAKRKTDGVVDLEPEQW